MASICYRYRNNTHIAEKQHLSSRAKTSQIAVHVRLRHSKTGHQNYRATCHSRITTLLRSWTRSNKKRYPSPTVTTLNTSERNEAYPSLRQTEGKTVNCKG
eukprot:1985083-Amphidinium_carterae.1